MVTDFVDDLARTRRRRSTPATLPPETLLLLCAEHTRQAAPGPAQCVRHAIAGEFPVPSNLLRYR
ncbi:hypothetical protein GCM10011588_00380 [Nocardia jinanensis]|uniref:Uncharacterized protein n=1 Tax=Nocardia jinanensis TaxID=382504 RepID=A0A917R553_9NOCA|nr:hypothetical protein GCM10011588_00380 [Nocardia jinanensis]